MKLQKLLAGAAACAVATSLFAAGSSVLADVAGSPLSTTHNIGKATVAPTIDGKLDDELWTTGVAFSKSNDFKYTDAAGNAQTWPGFQYKIAWDDNNLYLGVVMTDKSLFCNQAKAFSGEDGAAADAMHAFDYTNFQMEFSPTGNPGKMDDFTDTNYVDGDTQYIFTYQDDNKPCVRVGAWSQNDQQTRYASGVMNSMKLSCSKTAIGWDLEAALPWTSIDVTKPGAGSRFSFRLMQQVVTNNNAGYSPDSDPDEVITPEVNDITSSDGKTVDPDGYDSATWCKIRPWIDQMLLTNDAADAGSSSSTPSSSSSGTPVSSSSAPVSSSSSAPVSSSSSKPVSSSSSAPVSSSSTASAASSDNSASGSASSDSTTGVGNNSTPDYSTGSSTAAPATTGTGETSNVNTGTAGNTVVAAALTAVIAAASLIVLKKKK